MLGTLGTRTSAIVDLDQDGDLDIVTGEFNAQPQVLVSDLSDRHQIHWLKIELEGTSCNRDALGAEVSVCADGQCLLRLNDGKSGYLSQSSVPLYFGLGEASSVDRIVVRWPSGDQQTLEGPLEVNRSIRIRQRQ